MINRRIPRLLLVDGHYYLYRSFFAIRALKNSCGEPINAIYGFLKALRKIIADAKPDYAAVIWDAGLPKRRTELQASYKKQRKPMPEELKVQQKPIQEIIPFMGVASLFLANTEADDLIASYAIESLREPMECIIASNDKDILQLVRPGVSIYSTSKNDLSEKNAGFKLLDASDVRAKWGVDPPYIADVLALAGDSADNIPGIQGVGRKTAAQWIIRYGSLQQLLTSPSLEPKIAKKIALSKELIQKNSQIIALDYDLPLPLPLIETRFSPNYPKLIEALQLCELHSLASEVEQEFQNVYTTLLHGSESIDISSKMQMLTPIPQAVSSKQLSPLTQGELFL